MNSLLQKFNTGLPFPEVFPDSFTEAFGHGDYFSFRNLDHFRHVCSKLTQKVDDKCGISYAHALSKLLSGVSDLTPAEHEAMRESVRSRLHKRGLITEDTYEAYRYTTDGTQVGVDVGKYAAGEPDCVISPAVEYVDFFYELYINVSYPYSVEDETIRKTCAEVLAAIEELERQHIYIKVAMVLPIKGVKRNRRTDCYSNFFADVPLFSHKEAKDAYKMASVINERLLRKFFFAIIEDFYGDEIASGYGKAVQLNDALNLSQSFDPVDFFQNVVASVGA